LTTTRSVPGSSGTDHAQPAFASTESLSLKLPSRWTGRGPAEIPAYCAVTITTGAGQLASSDSRAVRSVVSTDNRQRVLTATHSLA
jgi:hypothetical protein